MAQSSLYKTSGTELAENVNVTSDESRALGVATVDEVSTPVDFTDDAAREIGQTSVTNTVTVEQANKLDVDIGEYGVITDSSTAAGSAGAATLNLGDFRQAADAYYEVTAASDSIHVEVSTTSDGTNWREVYSIDAADVVTGGQAIQFETSYQYVRVYAGSGYADSEVNVLELASKGI